MTQLDANNLFEEKNHVFLDDGAKVYTNIFVSKISSILSKLLEEYRPLKRGIMKDLIVFYVYNDKRVPTACVDENNHIYISVNYVYSILKMNDDLIYALLSNALVHSDYSDLADEHSFLSKGMPRGLFTVGKYVGKPVQLTLPLHHTLNIAAEIKANNMVLGYGEISNDVLEEQMNAVALKEHNRLSLGQYYHETELIDNWKERVGKAFPLAPSYKDNPMTYSSGYMQTIGEFIKSMEK